MMPTLLDPTCFRVFHRVRHERQLLALGCLVTRFSMSDYTTWLQMHAMLAALEASP